MRFQDGDVNEPTCQPERPRFRGQRWNLEAQAGLGESLAALPQQVGVQVDGARGIDVDVENLRFEAGRCDLDLMRSHLEGQALEEAVEVVHDAGVVPVHIDRGVTRAHLQANVAVVLADAVDRPAAPIPIDPPGIRRSVAVTRAQVEVQAQVAAGAVVAPGR